MSTTSISYDLFRENEANAILPVATQADLDVQAGIRDKDPDPIVDTDPDPEGQAAIVDEHVTNTLDEVDVAGHHLAFPHQTNSRWSSQANNWVAVNNGASVIYTVYPIGTNPQDSKLRLAVSTPA